MGGGTRRFKRRQQGEVKGERKPYEAIVKENKDFVEYYKAQNIIEDAEWDVFMSFMRRDLPTAFRIMGCSLGESRKLLEIVKGKLFTALINGQDAALTEDIKHEPLCLPWYPGGLGWQLEISRKDIRRSEGYFRLHNFLTSETACGAISRQEAVSMIPPLVLDVRPGHKVLDMCAAPGSKTAQLIELLHADGPGTPGGFVVANDIDNSRCYMLVHQAKRLNSPCVMVTNHDSCFMPNLLTAEGGALKYDRILCDVPCCGDGTLRKNPDIWQKWNTANGNNLHGVQYRVIKRGLEMLEVGGRVVYSTCSMNPVEDEAVIHRILAAAKGSVELVDVKESLPGLKAVAGVTCWRPSSRDLTLYDSYDEVPEKWRTQLNPAIFPPGPDVAQSFNLNRCLRVLPHFQDTGGFFVAALTKKGSLPWEVGGEDSVCGEPKKEPERKKRKIHGHKEDPYVFFSPDEPVWEAIREFYSIDGLDPKCLLTRCIVGKKKNIYYVSPELKPIVETNQYTVKIINTGVKVFSRSDNKLVGCNFRLVQEGLETIKCYIGPKRRLKLSKSELVQVLNHSDPKEPLEVTQLEESTQSRLQEISQGSCVLDYGEDDLSLSLVGWKGSRSLRAYVSNSDLVHYLRLLDADTTKFEVNKFKKDSASGQAASAEDVKPEVQDADTTP